MSLFQDKYQEQLNQSMNRSRIAEKSLKEKEKEIKELEEITKRTLVNLSIMNRLYKNHLIDTGQLINIVLEWVKEHGEK